ncbi:MAG: elongator complex protein 3 [Desulfovibrionaceae bacterium]
MQIFTHPEPVGRTPRLHPVFLPFAGCPQRCVYCSQHVQTGQAAQPLQTALDALDAALSRALGTADAPQREVAFYGGTFTALPAPWPQRFLAVAQRYKEAGLVSRVRCSTRPDAVDAAGLAALKAQGLDMVELGVQSFSDTVLDAAQRGYDAATAVQGCEVVRKAGLGLGIQLLPGLPGMRLRDFRNDIAATCAIRPEAVRLYPCVVMEGTPLATLWRHGAYTPWPLAKTQCALAQGTLELWRADCRVIRMGLAPEPSLLRHLLAGPWHPALGSMVRGLALALHIRGQLAGRSGPVRELFLPQRHAGEFWGHKKSLAPFYARLGLSTANAHPWARHFFWVR